MPVAPLLDCVLFTAHAVCPDGHEHGGLLMLPVQQRSLAAFDELTSQFTGPPCNQCGRPIRPTEIQYTFDEPDLPDLTYQAADGTLSCDGQPVTCEQDLIELIGRPFSVADLHRQQLTALTDVDIYRVGPGLICQAIAEQPGADPDEAARRVQRMFEQGLELLFADVPADPLTPAPVGVGWHRDPGLMAWAGPAAQRLTSGHMAAQNVLRGDLLMRALTAYEPVADPDAPAAPDVTFDVDRREQTLTPYAQLGGLRIDLNLTERAQITISRALTLHEAAAYIHQDVSDLLAAISAALSQIDPELLEATEIDGAELVHTPSGRVFDLEVMAEQVGRDVDAIIERVTERLRRCHSHTQPEPGILPCGCPARWGVVLRPSGVAADGRLHRLYEAHAVCPVADCDHHTAFVHHITPGDPEDQVWQDAVDGMAAQQFRVGAEPVTSLDGELVGAVIIGYNAASVACDGRWARQLAHTLGLNVDDAGDGELTVICVTCDLAAVGIPGCDPELLERSAAALARDNAGHQHVTAPATPLQVTFSAHGDRFGKFTLIDSPMHPVQRLLDAP